MLNRKSILITGSTDGIGKLAAIRLAKDGHQLYLHGRNKDKLTHTIKEVKDLSGHAHVQGYQCDFADIKAVMSFAIHISNEIPGLDILINNAGIFRSPPRERSDGLDIRIVVNYLAPYILTKGLLATLRKSSAPQIINLSSAAQSRVTDEVLRGTSRTSDSEAYAQSKLALLMWSFDLARTAQDITTIALNPGSLLDTNMVREAYGKSWSPAEKGGDIIYDLASVGKYQNHSGQYFDNDHGDFNQAHPDAYDLSRIKSLLRLTDAIIKEHYSADVDSAF